MFSQFLNKMTEKQSSKIDKYFEENASLDTILGDSEVVSSNSKWVLQQRFDK